MRLIVTTGAAAAARVLAVEARGLEDWRGLWPRLRRTWLRSRLLVFATGGAYDGGRRWKYTRDERARYVAVKARLTDMTYTKTLDTVLRWRGSDRLMRSFVDPSDAHNVYQTTRDTAAFGSRLPWAATNQYGIGRAPLWLGGHEIPARNMLHVGPRTEREFEGHAVDYVAERVDETTERVTAAAALGMGRRRAR